MVVVLNNGVVVVVSIGRGLEWQSTVHRFNL